MSYAVATMKKLKMSDLGGIQVELDRQYQDEAAYKNEVDLSRSSLNIEFVKKHNAKKGALRREVEKYINDNKSSERKIRKDAVVLNSWIITSDRAFFEKLSDEETLAYFKDALEFFAQRYGEQNVMHATVHLDETTPHMHLGIVPLKDGRLSSKSLITRNELQRLHDDFPAYMQLKGWDIERGVQGSERKHLDAPEYREAMERANDLTEQNIALEREMKNKALDIIEIETPNAQVSPEKYKKHFELAEDKDEFVEKYGKNATVVSEGKGRQQMFDWVTLHDLWNAAMRLLKKIDERLRTFEQQAADMYYRNSLLADAAIKLGAEDKQRDQMIENGVVTLLEGQDQRDVNLSDYLPFLLENASNEQLEANSDYWRDFQQDKEKGFDI